MTTSLKTLNLQYLRYLAKYPLLTKSVTAGLLSGLNEIIASLYTGDVETIDICGIKVRKLLTSKTIGLIIYGFCISTPIAHYLYSIINQIFIPPLSNKGKLLQILTSLSTVTPSIAAAYAGWIGLLNAYHPNPKNDLVTEIKQIWTVFIGSIAKNFKPIVKTSLFVTSISLVVAQKYVAPELWVVFFALVSFFVGTFLNIKLKQKQLKQKKE
jgi:peroxisomal membrane protein 2